ncbi:DUF1349 domain-containing protein [Pendulispora albinea]|uniref:DUF1349 domain-containing protein n=1 Tax=Pendulispora albinea TaxID=2741071 RepID=A0ABZ2LYX9_9BACT
MEGNRTIPWNVAHWLNRPPSVDIDGDDLIVSTADRSDFWRRTSYGFIHDNGHALLAALPLGTAIEVTYEADFEALFDQAGIMVRVDERTWVKAGVEFSDGVPQLGAVATREFSDWSLAPAPEWIRRPITVRASRSGDALTIRAHKGDGQWQLVRVTPLAPDVVANAGPFCCSPTRRGLVVRFTRFVRGAADASLHAEGPGV